MFGTFFAALLLGHLVGDYLFQTNWMACTKWQPGREGWQACLIHCAVYSSTVAGFLVVILGLTGTLQIGFWLSIAAFGIVFLTHYPIDRTSFAKKILEWKGNETPAVLSMKNSGSPKDILDVSVWFLVYVVVDNTCHLVLMSLLLYPVLF